MTGISGIQGAREPRCRHAVEGVCFTLSRCPSHSRTAPWERTPLHGDNSLLTVISVLDHESGEACIIQI